MRIGVFVCHCGSNIGGTVDCAQVAKNALGFADVVYATDLMYTCAEPGQAAIEKAIHEHNLTGVVVASCTPRMHEPTFRRTVERAGLNKYMFEMANIREHVSWIGKDKEANTNKAAELVRIAVEKLRRDNPLFSKSFESTKRVLVIGGGVAGMNAAISCADRGHSVVLYEKTDRLGGQALLSDPMWFKKEMKLFHEYLERQVKKRPAITVVYNTMATPEIIEQNDFDAVIVAVGAEQIVPPIPGVEKAKMSFDVFGHEDTVGKKVVIIGGGAIGVELGIHLNGLGHECTIVEMAEYLASKAQLTERTAYLIHLEKTGVDTMVNTACREITDKGVWVENEDGRKFLEADTVIISVGTKSLVKERDQFTDSAFDVINVGDCVKASSIVHAVHTGFDAGLTL